MIMIPSGMLTTFSIILTIESDTTNGDGAIRSRNVSGGGAIENPRIVKNKSVDGGRTLKVVEPLKAMVVALPSIHKVCS